MIGIMLRPLACEVNENGAMRASIRGTELFYEAHGTGRPLLLMHGGMGHDHAYLRPWLDRLAGTFRLVFYDHRGNGRSERSASLAGVGLDTWADDANALRQHLELGTIVVFGHSFGGFVALEYARRHPDTLAGLILCSTAPAWDYEEVAAAGLRARATDDQVAAVAAGYGPEPLSEQAYRDRWEQILPLYFHRYDPAVGIDVHRRTRYSSQRVHPRHCHLPPRLRPAAPSGMDHGADARAGWAGRLDHPPGTRRTAAP